MLAPTRLCNNHIIMQVVMGVLGCPNMPVAAVTDGDGGADAAGRVGDDDVGVIFAAQLGGGATVGPLKGGKP